MTLPHESVTNSSLVLANGIMLNKNYGLSQDELDAYYSSDSPATFVADECGKTAMIGVPFVDVRSGQVDDPSLFYATSEESLCVCERHAKNINRTAGLDYEDVLANGGLKIIVDGKTGTVTFPTNGQRRLSVRVPTTKDAVLGDTVPVYNRVYVLSRPSLSLANHDPCHSLVDGEYVIDENLVRKSDVQTTIANNLTLAKKCSKYHRAPTGVVCAGGNVTDVIL